MRIDVRTVLVASMLAGCASGTAELHPITAEPASAPAPAPAPAPVAQPVPVPVPAPAAAAAPVAEELQTCRARVCPQWHGADTRARVVRRGAQ